jgi:hypothetical protein
VLATIAAGVVATLSASGPPARAAALIVNAGYATGLTATTGDTQATNCKAAGGTTGASGTGETPGALPQKPTGVVAVNILGTSTSPPFSAPVAADPLLSGLDLLAQWCNIEPEQGVFNWAPLDQTFAAAAANGKFVILTLIPGVESPAWAVDGTPFVMTGFAYGAPVAARGLPLPWNRKYLRRWFAFLRAVAKRYGSNPAFRMIEVGGPTSVSTEMSLPHWTGQGSSIDTGLPPIAGGSDLTMWKDVGYTPARYVAAWRYAFAQYHLIFPNQYLGLALVNGLPLGAHGAIDPSEIARVPLEVIAAGMRYAKSLDVQTDGVGPGSGRPPFGYVQAACGRAAVTGFQTIVPASEGPLAIDTLPPAWQANADFVEVYESDVTGSLGTGATGATQLAAIESAHSALPASAGCTPLTIAGDPLTVTPEASVNGENLLSEEDWTETDYDPPYPQFAQSAVINVFENGHLFTSCSSAPCTLPATKAGSRRVLVSADVGATGVTPYSSQAITSAQRVIFVSAPSKPVPPHCKGSACM